MSALELASLVIDVAPHHAAAHAIASQVRQTLAQQRFDRAQAFFQQGLVGKHITDYAHERHAVLRADALRAEAEGRIDHAIEAWVRLSIAGPMDRDTRSHFDDLLRRARGVDGIRWAGPAVSSSGR